MVEAQVSVTLPPFGCLWLMSQIDPNATFAKASALDASCPEAVI